VVKDPFFCETLHHWVEVGANIEHVVVCSRDFTESAKSALACGLAEPVKGDLAATVERFRNRYTRLVETIQKFNLNYSIIKFPRSVHDRAYTFDGLKPLLNVSYNQFSSKFDETVDTDYLERVRDECGD